MSRENITYLVVAIDQAKLEATHLPSLVPSLENLTVLKKLPSKYMGILKISNALKVSKMPLEANLKTLTSK